MKREKGEVRCTDGQGKREGKLLIRCNAEGEGKMKCRRKEYKVHVKRERNREGGVLYELQWEGRGKKMHVNKCNAEEEEKMKVRK